MCRFGMQLRIYIHIYVCVYIYIERERERERFSQNNNVKKTPGNRTNIKHLFHHFSHTKNKGTTALSLSLSSLTGLFFFF